MSLINIFIIIILVLLYYLIHYIFDATVTKNITNNKNKIIITKPIKKSKNDNIYVSLNKSSSHSSFVNPAIF